MTTAEIRAIPLFKNVSPRSCKKVARLFDRVSLPAGRTITREGDTAREFFVIIEGSADVMREGRRVAVLGAGDFFGEIGLVSEHRMATVIARSSLDVAVIARRDFHQLLTECPDVASTVLTTGSRRAVSTLRQVEAAQNERAAARQALGATNGKPLVST